MLFAPLQEQMMDLNEPESEVMLYNLAYCMSTDIFDC